VLLSSLQGAASPRSRSRACCTNSPPFRGLREDVTDIVLTSSRSRLRMHAEGPKRVSLRRQRARGEVKAGRFSAQPTLKSQSRPGALHPGREGRFPHGTDHRHRQGVMSPPTATVPKTRPIGLIPVRFAVLAGQEGLLQGREHPRGPDSRL
jgi:DNA-directed RNA polymerase subunit alpha